MSWHSQVVLAAWGLLGLAMVWAHVADAVERRRMRRLAAAPRCPVCGTPTEHVCSWVCVEVCPNRCRA